MVVIFRLIEWQYIFQKQEFIFHFDICNFSLIAWLFTACYIRSKRQHSPFEVSQNSLDHICLGDKFFCVPKDRKPHWTKFQHVGMSIRSYFCAAYLRRHVCCRNHASLLYFPINIDGSLWQHVAFAQTSSVPFASFFL